MTVTIGRVGVAGVPRGRAMVRSSLLAWQLAKEVKRVKKRFAKGQEDLAALGGPLALIERTQDDLHRAFDKVDRKGELLPLLDWADSEFQRARAALEDEVRPEATARSRPAAVPRIMLASLRNRQHFGLRSVVRWAGNDSPASAEEDGLSIVDRLLDFLFGISKSDNQRVELCFQSMPRGSSDSRLDIYLHRYKDNLKKRTTIRPSCIPKLTRGDYDFAARLEGFKEVLCDQGSEDRRGPPCPLSLVITPPIYTLQCDFAPQEEQLNSTCGPAPEPWEIVLP